MPQTVEEHLDETLEDDSDDNDENDNDLDDDSIQQVKKESGSGRGVNGLFSLNFPLICMHKVVFFFPASFILQMPLTIVMIFT